MAIDNRLQVFNEEGQSVDYDIMATDVKFADGKDLPTKLDELEDEIGEGGYTPPPGGIPKTDLAPAVQQTLDDVANKVDKVTGKGLSSNDYTDTDKAKVNNLKPVATSGSYNDLTDKPTIPTVPTMDAVPTAGNTTHTVSSDGVAAAIAQAGGQVTVTTNGDGTFTIHAADDYTINLNHTHEHMAKLEIVYEEPSSPALDTIYAVVDNTTSPQEIISLFIAGLEFVGGVLPDEPILRRPADGSTVDFGKGDSLTKVITVKGINLANDLTLELSGSGYSFGTTQPTGVTRTDGTHMTITAAAANTGVNIVVDYAETGLYASGTLSIEGSSDGIDTEVTLVANTDVVAYWDGGDAVQSSKWVDRVNQIPFVMSGTAEKTADGYHLNNLSSQRNAYMLTDSSKNTLLNTLIKKEFTCYVDFKVKIAQTGKSCTTIDFGVNGESLSTLALGCTIYQDGRIITTFKLNGEQTGFFEEEKYAQLDSALTLNTYVTLQLKIGARILANGKQELYTEIDGKKCYAVLNSPVDFNFTGCGGSYPVTSAASLGYGFDRNATTDFPNGSYDIVYQKIVIYNTAR